MKIECLFILREPTDEIPEMIAAWDEYSISENPDGWTKECKRALDSCRGEVHTHQFITIDVPESDIITAMTAPKIPGKVEKKEPSYELLGGHGKRSRESVKKNSRKKELKNEYDD